MDRVRCLQQVRVVEERGRRAMDVLELEHQRVLEQYRASISHGMGDVTSRLRAWATELTSGNPTCERLIGSLNEYVDWLQWSFWDMPYMAVAMRLEPAKLTLAVQSSGMLYLSLRVFDDAIDRHHAYKGRHDTLLSLSHRDRRSNQSADALAILGGLVLCFEGLNNLCAQPDSAVVARLRAVVRPLCNTVLGAIMELSPNEDWTPTYYERLIALKNVEFWKVLYSGLDPEGTSELKPFWERYYALAQKLNDVQDHADDARRNQPNLVAIQRGAGPSADCSSGPTGIPLAVEAAIAQDLIELAEQAERLGGVARLVAEAKLGQCIAEARRAKLFGEPPCSPALETSRAAPLGLDWYADSGDVVFKLGPDALVRCDCGACGGSAGRFLFQKHGFAFHRCGACSHVFVSPRLRPDLARRFALELDDSDHDSSLMEAQKYYAPVICSLLRARAPGSRLLDIGFGRGYLLDSARAYGFEVYGLETSPKQIERLAPALGERLHRGVEGDVELPWGAFDVIVMSHVLEHLDTPRSLLDRVREALNPEGITYVAVPDIESAQFRVFGKNWEAISPLSHVQYFNARSLEKALLSSGFDQVERVEHSAVPQEFVPPWMRLMRELGGTEAGELIMVARRPPL